MRDTQGAISFVEVFKRLHDGRAPFPWQRDLHDRFCRGVIPKHCALPTGLGKTSVISIWLLALASEAESNSSAVSLPRRLIYIVNRRTIVDQATDVAQVLRAKLNSLSSDPAVSRLREAIKRLSSDSAIDPLAVSTLRGELADNGEWKVDPARPAVIIGTVDMIGSKLLFSGYGDRRYKRPHHAGLIGQDALIVLDEAHLSPALATLLRKVEDEQARTGKPRPIRVMEMSATLRDGEAGAEALRLKDQDWAEPLVKQRLNAVKRLTIRELNPKASKEGDPAATPEDMPDDAGSQNLTDGSRKNQKKVDVIQPIANAALEHKDAKAAVLAYVRLPETANRVAEAIRKKLGNGAEGRVKVLTGTIRGYERDQLAQDPLFKAFKPAENRQPLQETLYLISTSAGEVGVDLDADHMVCDLTPLESMIQRLGRVNRIGGEQRAAEITVIYETPEDKKQAKQQDGKDDRRKQTLAALESLPERDGARDASPHALLDLLNEKDRQGGPKWKDAFSPTPKMLPATDILFDAWSLTSIQGSLPGRPEVAPYLHGLTDDPPETYVAWRADVRFLAESIHAGSLDTDSLEEILDAYPVKPWERLRDTAKRVREKLQAITQRARPDDENSSDIGEMPVILLGPGGNARMPTIREAAQWNLDYHTLILPIEAGGLSDDGSLKPEAKGSSDVADVAGGQARLRRRVLLAHGEEGWQAACIPTPPGGEDADLPTSTFDDWPSLSDAVCKTTEMVIAESVAWGGDEDSGPDRVLLYLVGLRDSDAPSTAAQQNQLLVNHTEAVISAIRRIGEALRLDKSIREALVIAARWHDRGKDRAIWQRYACNSDVANPLAKSQRYRHGRMLNGYRHEFGSLYEAAADPEVAKDPERDLILHLIAAHHGWARPHFEPSAYDNEGPLNPSDGTRRTPASSENEAVALEVMRRYSHLQRRFGRWGLAWLESLLRCADALASRGVTSDRQGATVRGDREMGGGQ